MHTLKAEDTVTIHFSQCNACEDTVGYVEPGMKQYEGDTFKISRSQFTRYSHLSPRCGARVFEYNTWIWTSCWVINHTSKRKPDWEV